MSSPETPPPSKPKRLASLDQFRGYTVAGMLLVNFVGGFQAVPAFFKHHNTYCSYADTIMPQFFLAVGIAYRLTWLSRRDREGLKAANWHAFVRGISLMVLGAVIYHLDADYKSWAEMSELGVSGVLSKAFQRNYFQTLVHIGLTMIWVLPVIGARPLVRVAYMIGSAVAFQYLSGLFYFEFALKRPCIDGGSLAILTWTIPVLVGSLTWDLIKSGKGMVSPLLSASVGLMTLGYILSCLGPHGLASPPFCPPYQGHATTIWTMSQRTGSNSYLIFSTGFSLLVFLGFHLACDVSSRPLNVPMFRTFGQQALLVYIVHPMVNSLLKPFIPKDSPGWYVLGMIAAQMGITYLFARHFEKNKIDLHV